MKQWMLLICTLIFSNCGYSSTPPKGVDKAIYENYMKIYTVKWDNIKSIPKGALEAAIQYIGKDYIVPFMDDIDSDGVVDYLVIEKANKYYNAVFKAILVDG